VLRENRHPADEDRSLDPGALRGAVPSPTTPRFIPPELATLVKDAPEDSGWLHEVKFDGYRVVATIDNGSVTMYSRNEKDWTEPFAAIAAELARLPAKGAVLDGEVAMVLPDGRTSFQELRDSLGEQGRPVRERGGNRLVYHVFDLLYLDGYDLTKAALEDRKELLRDLVAAAGPDSRLRYSEHIAGNGAAVFDQACRLDLEGIVSKRSSTPYRPGVRGGEWVKTKCKNRQEFVIGGYTDPAGARTGFGALLLGVREGRDLRYVSRVGTGFDDRTLTTLASRMRALEIAGPPFTLGVERAPKGSHWVRPELVAEVEFAEWTRDGGIRHPSFKGLRLDKDARDVVAESPSPIESPALAGAQTAAHDQPAAEDPPGPGAGRVSITHPERVFWPAPGITKLDLIHYYDMVAERMLPYVIDRPVAMVRCPSGVEDGEPQTVGRGGRPPGCFFHKHPGDDFPGPVGRVMITESAGPAPYLTITGPGSLAALAQMGVLEIHVWGSTWPDIEQPDMIVFDLDPGPGVEWPALAEGARLVRKVVGGLGLESFVKTTGGKGLHVVVPLTPNEEWREVARFCRRVAEVMVDLAPNRFTANMSKAKRAGKIYVDYVRNNRGSTSIAPYSTRAKERPTVAVPLRWTELSGSIRPDTYTLETLSRRLERQKSDPWEGYFAVRDAQKLDLKTREALG